MTPAAAREVELLVAEGLSLHAIGERLGVHRRTILRWVERDADFRQRYERARRFAHELLYDELREVIVRPAVTRGEIYAAAAATAAAAVLNITNRPVWSLSSRGRVYPF